MKTLTALVATAILAVSGAHAQTAEQGSRLPSRQGLVGFGIDGSLSSGNFIVSLNPSSNLAIELQGGLSLDSYDVEAGPGQVSVDGLGYQAGLGLFYHPFPSVVSPYFGVEGMFISRTEAGIFPEDAEPDPLNSVQGNLVFGLEYFVHPVLSVGIKNSLGMTFDLERDLPAETAATHFNTNTKLTGRFYIR